MLTAFSLLVLAQPNLSTLEQGCDGKKVSACRQLAEFHLDPTHRDERRAYAALEAGCSLNDPVASNPFGLVLGVGTVAGVVRAGLVQWRVLTGWVDGWFSFDPGVVSVVPALGTQVAFALGHQELSLEVGARLPLTLVSDAPTLRPRAFEPALFAALLFRPSF